jgi:hypothetical protein
VEQDQLEQWSVEWVTTSTGAGSFRRQHDLADQEAIVEAGDTFEALMVTVDGDEPAVSRPPDLELAASMAIADGLPIVQVRRGANADAHLDLRRRRRTR